MDRQSWEFKRNGAFSPLRKTPCRNAGVFFIYTMLSEFIRLIDGRIRVTRDRRDRRDTRVASDAAKTRVWDWAGPGARMQLGYASSDVSPSRIAYFVSSATKWMLSFSMI